MKDDIACIAELNDYDQRRFNQPRFADCWRHQYSLAPKPNTPLDVLEVRCLPFHLQMLPLTLASQWYIAIIREQTQRDMRAKPHSERVAFQERETDTDMYWGYFWAELGYTFGPHFDHMTLAEAAHREFSAIESILARALSRK